jgi:hypothetical protein
MQRMQSEQAHGMNLAEIRCMFRLSLRILWTDPDEIPSLIATSWIVSLLFSRTCSLFYPYFQIILLVTGCPEHQPSSAEVTPREVGWPFKSLCSSPLSAEQVLPQFFNVSVAFFPPQCKAKCDAGTLFFQVCHSIRMSEWQNPQFRYLTYSIMTLLQPFYKQGMI